jgi:hypothetical protein
MLTPSLMLNELPKRRGPRDEQEHLSVEAAELDQGRSVGAMTLPSGSRRGISSFSSVVGSRGPTPASTTALSPKVPKTRSQTMAAQA